MPSSSATRDSSNRAPAKIMKPILIACLLLTGCTVTTVKTADGTETVTKTPAPGSLELAGKALEVIAGK